MFLTSLKQTYNEYLIKFSENQSASKLESWKTSPCSPPAPNLFHALPSRLVGWHKLCNPGERLYSSIEIAKMMPSLSQHFRFSSFSPLISLSSIYPCWLDSFLNICIVITNPRFGANTNLNKSIFCHLTRIIYMANSRQIRIIEDT